MHFYGQVRNVDVNVDMDLNLDLNLIVCRPWLWIWDMLDIYCVWCMELTGSAFVEYQMFFASPRLTSIAQRNRFLNKMQEFCYASDAGKVCKGEGGDP